MAKIIYTADEVIKSVRQRARIGPSTSQGWADVDILRVVNEEMDSEIVPRIITTREEYFVAVERIPLTATEAHYRISPRASGQRLRDVLYADNLSPTSIRVNLPKITRESMWDILGETGSNAPKGFYLEGNHVVLVPDTSGGTGNLELSFFFAPGQLVPDAEVRKVTLVSTSTKTVTLDSPIPSGWGTSSTFDIHSQFSGAEIHEWDLTTASVGASTVTFNEEIDGSVFGRHPVLIGDYLALAGEAALPGIPEDLIPCLVQAAVCQLVEAEGDMEALTFHTAKLNRILKNAFILTEARVEGEPEKIVARGSILFQQGYGYSSSRRIGGFY